MPGPQRAGGTYGPGAGGPHFSVRPAPKSPRNTTRDEIRRCHLAPPGRRRRALPKQAGGYSTDKRKGPTSGKNPRLPTPTHQRRLSNTGPEHRSYLGRTPSGRHVAGGPRLICDARRARARNHNNADKLITLLLPSRPLPTPHVSPCDNASRFQALRT